MAIPPNIKEPWLKSFFETFNATVKKENMQLVGGDLSKSGSDLFINVHVSGLVRKDQIKWRSKLGEASTLFVTGYLGDSSAGFRALEESDEQSVLIDKHKKPAILTKVSHWLARRSEVLGMMDLSDGLLSDLKRVPSGQIEIFMEKIPHSDPLRNYCRDKNEDLFKFSLGGGEDYELLLSCQSEKANFLRVDFEKEFGTPLFEGQAGLKINNLSLRGRRKRT
jgi:thiamine-monophosphate kinase